MKKRMAWLLIAILLLTGCRKEALPVYYMKVWEDGVHAPMVMDGVHYADADLVTTGPARTWPDIWEFTGEKGAVIGIGGDPKTGKGGYDIYEVDADRKFLYLQPNHFVFGPYYTFLCVREDVTLTPPSAEAAGRVVLEVEEEEVREITDPAQIAALFAFYEAGEGKLLKDSPPEERTAFTIRIYHRDYPFLSAECSGTRKNETGEAYLACPDREWRVFTAWEIDFQDLRRFG